MSQTSAKTVSATAVHAVITRADGRVEDLGLISYRSRSPLKRWAYRLGQFVGFWRR